MARIKITNWLNRKSNSTRRIRKRTLVKNFLLNRVRNLKNLSSKAKTKGFDKIRGRISKRLLVLKYKRTKTILLQRRNLRLMQSNSVWIIIIEFYEKYKLYIHIFMVIILPPVRRIILPYEYIPEHIVTTNPYIHDDVRKKIVMEIVKDPWGPIFIPLKVLERFQEVFHKPYLLEEDRKTILKSLIEHLLDPTQSFNLADRIKFFGSFLGGLSRINPNAFREMLETLIILVKSGLIPSVIRLMLITVLSALPLKSPLLKQLIELLKNYKDNKPFDQ